MNLEESNEDLITVLLQQMPGRTKEDDKKLKSGFSFWGSASCCACFIKVIRKTVLRNASCPYLADKSGGAS
jgi:hypothetical protein